MPRLFRDASSSLNDPSHMIPSGISLHGSSPIVFPRSSVSGLHDSPGDPCDVPVPDPDALNPVRPGSTSTNRSPPGSSSDLQTPSRPEDSAQRLPADLPPFHYSSLMTHHALNYNGWDYDPCRLSSDGRLRVVMDPLFQRPRHGEVPIGQSKQRQGSSADFLI